MVGESWTAQGALQFTYGIRCRISGRDGGESKMIFLGVILATIVAYLLIVWEDKLNERG
jgi:hypothetical protein